MLLHDNTEHGIPTLFGHVDGAGKSDAKSKTDKGHSGGSHSSNNSTAIATQLNDFVTAFTSDTWGVTLTLPDFPYVVGAVAQKEGVQKKSHGHAATAHATPGAIADKEVEKTVLKLYDQYVARYSTAHCLAL